MNSSPVVLYVEDDPRSRRVMELYLRGELGLEHVVLLPDSNHFAEIMSAQALQPDIVLLDIQVKPYDGFEMLQMLRAMPAYARTPVVALTASVMNEEVDRLRRAGFDGVIPKPVDLDHLADLLQRVLRRESIWNIVET